MLVDIGLEFYSASSLSWGMTNEVKVTDLEISYKSKKKLHLSLYSYIMKTLLLVSLILSMMVYIGLKFF